MKKWLIIVLMVVIGCFLFPSFSSANQKEFSPTNVDIYWLTQNIYHEARGEGTFGMIMVGYVTLQRLTDGRWGNTIKKVVTSKHQFSWYWDGKSDIPKDELSWNTCKSAAMVSILLNGITGYQGVIYYHDPRVNPKWRYALDQIGKVGNHIVYKDVD